MATVEVFGKVNENGEVEIEQPQGLHAGKRVKVTITELDEPQEKENWGAKVVALLDQLDMSAWEALDIDDPVEWVKNQRREAERQRGITWGDE